MADASYKYIVIGKGMIGSAAARHLAERTDGVALIGPDEPRDPANHDGVFADHYDEGGLPGYWTHILFGRSWPGSRSGGIGTWSPARAFRFTTRLVNCPWGRLIVQSPNTCPILNR